MSSVKRYYFNGRRADLHSGYSCSEPGDNTGYYYRECDYATLERECEEAWDEAHKLQVEHDELFDEAVSLKARAEAAEAKLTSIMEWARGRCECCGNLRGDPMTCRDCMYREGCIGGEDYWKPLYE